jgi:hypothetical protein
MRIFISYSRVESLKTRWVLETLRPWLEGIAWFPNSLATLGAVHDPRFLRTAEMHENGDPLEESKEMTVFWPAFPTVSGDEFILTGINRYQNALFILDQSQDIWNSQPSHCDYVANQMAAPVASTSLEATRLLVFNILCASGALGPVAVSPARDLRRVNSSAGYSAGCKELLSGANMKGWLPLVGKALNPVSRAKLTPRLVMPGDMLRKSALDADWSLSPLGISQVNMVGGTSFMDMAPSGGNNDAALGIRVLALLGTTKELNIAIAALVGECTLIRQKHQHASRSWLSALLQFASYSRRWDTKVRTYSVVNLPRWRRLVRRYRRSRRLFRDRGPQEKGPLETVAQLFRGSEGALAVGHNLKARTLELVRRRSLSLVGAGSALISEPDTVFSLYNRMPMPSRALVNGSFD